MIGVLASGTGTNLQALLDAGLEVAAVASDVEGARALERAAIAGVSTRVFSLQAYPTREARDTAMADWLEKHSVSLVVCAGYMHLLTPGFLDRFPTLNVHPSLLPAFPGLHAIEDVLAVGADETGVTVHWVDEGVDTGPIVFQEAVPVRPHDTPETLHSRVQQVEHRLLPAAVRLYFAGGLRSPRQE